MAKRRKEKNNKSFKRVGLCVGCFLLMTMIGGMVFIDADGNASMPDWYIRLVWIVPIILAIYDKEIVRKILRIGAKSTGKVMRSGTERAGKAISKKINPTGEFRVPKTKRGQEKLAEELLLDAQINRDLVNKSADIGGFVLFYDDLLECLRKMSMLDKVSYRNKPEYDYSRLQSEMQWHMCDALERNKEKVIEEIKGKYRNSREFQEKQYENFKSEIEELRPRFSEQTYEFATKCLGEIEKVLGFAPNYTYDYQPQPYSGMAGVDLMEGHQFEYWCAGLLKKVGYINVEVTQGSGDQGVDILAEKDGIKYAIQCKRYDSDLGNKPVQEVNTGKAIYGCQIGAVMTNRYFTQGGKDAAKATGVLLWDRDWIQAKMNEALQN